MAFLRTCPNGYLAMMANLQVSLRSSEALLQDVWKSPQVELAESAIRKGEL